MALKDFWNKLTGGDKVDRVDDELLNDGQEQPEPVQDYEARKDDAMVDQRFRGSGTIGENSDL
jgi:hypothetical protein